MKDVLVPLPDRGFDPSEAAISWRTLKRAGHRVRFATPSGSPGQADHRMLSGKGLGPWSAMLRADENARAAYAEMEKDPEFLKPLRHSEVEAPQFAALLLPGGHAKAMRPYLESERLQRAVASFFDDGKPVAAICHGVVLAAGSLSSRTGRSVLHGRKTTALTAWMELSAWALTGLWLGSYYRTYPETVESEVTRALASRSDFLRGPYSTARDDERNLERGFFVRDGNYVSGRWPGDAHRFASEFCRIL